MKAVVLACMGAALLATCTAAPVHAAAGPAAPRHPVAHPVLRCTQPRALDGDTIRCANLPASVRLTGIDAPELPGHCRRGRACAPGDPVASRAALVRALRAPVTVEVIGTDLYRRTIGLVRSGPRNLSCAQIASGNAIYRGDWDHGHRIARECGQ